MNDNEIENISALSNLTSLQTLRLNNNLISDISPLNGLTNLQELRLDSNVISDFSPLSNLSNLQELNLFRTEISDLSPLSSLTNLQELNLYNNQITDISPLSGLVNLTFLWLRENQITDISALSSLTALESLNLFENQLTDLSPLSGLVNLQSLDLRYTQIEDISQLDGLVNLQNLLLSNNQIQDISSLNGFSNLQKLELYNNKIGNISALTGMDQLERLLIYNNYIDVSDGSEARTLVIDPLIETGTIVHYEVQYDPIPVIEVTPNTIILAGSPGDYLSTQFTIRNTGLGNLGWIAGATEEWVYLNPASGTVAQGGETTVQVSITCVPEFEGSFTFEIIIPNDDANTPILEVPIEIHSAIDIPDNNLRLAIETALGKNTGDPIVDTEIATLTELTATGVEISDLAGLEHATSLTHLDLYDNQITDLSPISGLTNLQELVLDRNLINDISPLSSLINLQRLDLDHNSISDLSPLNDLSNLQVLNLLANQISDLSPLSELANLQELTLGYNQIFDLTPLSGLSALQVLDLNVNLINDLSPLNNLSSLEQLSLYHNQITDISPLGGLVNLQILRANDNQVTEVSPLAALTSLETLVISKNQISDISHLGGLSNLTQLRIQENRISSITSLAGLVNLEGLAVFDNYIDITDGSEARILVIDPLVAADKYVVYAPQLADRSKLDISPDSLSLAGSPGDSLSTFFTIRNSGTNSLTWSFSTSDSWITFGQESGTVEPGNEISIQASIESIPDYTDSLDGTITIYSNDPSTPSLDISVSIYPPVDIPDTNLLKAMNLALGTPPGSGVSKEQLATLTELNAMDMNVSDLSGLEHAVNLTSLNLSNNQISDLSPLAGLTNLTHLYLYNNKLTDIAALAGLDQLEVLRIYGNYLDIADGSEARTGVIDPLIDDGAEVLYTPQLESEIEISPTSLVLIGNPGDSLSASINLANTGTNDLVWSSSSGDTWITTDSASGIIEPGNSQDVAITVDLVPDFSEVLYGIITLASNDADTPVLEIPMEVHSPIEIGDAALRSVIEEALGLDTGSPIIAPDLATLTYLDASNLGISDLSGLEFAVNLEYLNLQGNLIDISNGSNARVQVIDPLVAGGTDVIFSPQLAPKLEVDPMELIFAGESGGFLSASISMENTGQLDLTWSVGETAEWVILGPITGTISPNDSESISLSIDSIPAFVDSLSGSIVLESNDPDTPSVTVTVEIYPPIEIPDPNLQSAIEEALGLDPGSTIIATQLAELTTLDASDREIMDLSGIEYAVNLVSLDLGNNSVTELDPLQELAQLDFLDVRMNLLDIRSGSSNRDMIDQLSAYATVHFSPQRYPMRNFADFLTDNAIPDGLDGFLDTNGPLEIPNLMAFAMGIDPMTATPDMLPQTVRDEEAGSYSFCFYRNLSALDVELLIESSADMETWTPVSPGELNILSETGTGQQYVEAAFGEEDEPIFFRVRAVPDGQ